MARKWDTGTVRPYRPAPADFRDRFLALGFSKELREELRTNDRCIARWIDECGGDALRAERAAITGSPVKPSRRRHSRRRAYVMGTLRTPRFWDYGLLPEEGK